MKEARPQSLILRQRKNHLPDDIVLDIVAKLPVKSLLRIRRVHKSWYFRITSPNFISTHLNMLLCHNQGYVIHMPSINLDNQGLKVACDHMFDGISELKIPFSFQSGLAFLVGSCNGLLCFSDWFNDVFLWNPSIRKFKKLPDTCLSQLHLAKLGFAHHSQKNDYKVVRISRPFTEPMPPPEAEVYTLCSDSWKRVGISWRPNVVFYKFSCVKPFPFVSGHLHWMLDMKEKGGGQEMRYIEMILSFDVNSEKFKELPLPNDHSFKDGKCLTSVKEKLALTKFERQPHGMLCCIWVMREYGVCESWSKLCVVPIETRTCFIGFTKYGSLLIQKKFQEICSLEDKYVLIDPETLYEKETSIQAIHPLVIATYMENLALLDGTNVISY
ncbi:F-box/kelch-repeat protein At3g06240-like [Castanea sativa]|uniref:F-box/kelch-repeat protein At3g06240-like n=1 Tax=Castanea sativa TaxID=21020 RepID=UPI003F64F4F6